METDMHRPMIMALILLPALCPVGVAIGDATPRGVRYMGYEQWGGTWSDVEKDAGNASEESLLCWAYAAANILDWTGWGHTGGMDNADDMFDYIRDHWENGEGLSVYPWRWWFDGVNYAPAHAAAPDVPGGGGFYPNETSLSHTANVMTKSSTMWALDFYLRDGWGASLFVFGPGSHVITAWGFNYNPDDPSEYYGVWVTDSDDDKNDPTPPDRLRYYEVVRRSAPELGVSDGWFLQGFYDSNDWVIQAVQFLDPAPTPEPATAALLAAGALLALRRRRRS
jgi:hypothetical protein